MLEGAGIRKKLLLLNTLGEADTNELFPLKIL